MDGKTPPNAIDLERDILGAILLEKSAIDEVSDMLRAEHFYLDSHKLIYKACIKMARANNPIDIETITYFLRREETLDAIGGPYYLVKLTRDVVSSANIVPHCRIIIREYIRRVLAQVSMETLKGAYDEGKDEFVLLQDAENTFSLISHEIEHTNTIPLESMAMKFMKNREASNGDPDNMIFTGIQEWDEVNGPLFNGGIYVIGGRPGSGKTAFVVELIKRMAEKYPIGFINLEMTTDQLIKRFISNTREIDNAEFKKAKEDAPAWLEDKMQEGAGDFINLKLTMDSNEDLTMDDIISKFKYWKHKFGIKAGFIDYLQVVRISEERQRYNTELENINYNLGQLTRGAKKLDIPIFLLSQLNRESLKRGGNKEPEISDMKGSGKIEEVAYQIAFLHRPEYHGILTDLNGETTKNLAYLDIKKHRDGELRKIKLKFEGQYSRFSSWDMPRFNAPLSFTDDQPF